MKDKEPLISLRDLLTIAFKHKHKIFFSFVPIVFIAVFIAFALPAYYMAKTVIMVKPGWDIMPAFDGTGTSNRMPSVGVETMVNTEIQILTSHDLLEKVVAKVGAFQIYPDLQRAGLSPQQIQVKTADRILYDLEVRPVKSSNVIEVLYRHRDPRIAATVVNTLVIQLRNEHLKIFGETGYPLMEEQLKISDAHLREALDKFQVFKDGHGMARLKGLVAKRAEAESSLRAETGKFEELRKHIASIKSQKRKPVSDMYTADVGSKLVDLEVKETQLLATFKENSRPVLTVRKEIQKVKDALRQHEDKVNGSQEQASLEAEIGPREMRITGLRQHVAQLDKRLSSFGYDAEEFSRLERNVNIAQARHESNLQKQEELRIQEEKDRRKASSIQIIESAAIPFTPVKENQGKVVGVGLILAVVASFGLTCLAEYVPQGITGPRGVSRRVRLPVLVSVAYKR